jgi:hypothetical protein
MSEHLTERDRRLVVAIADDALSGRRRRRAEQRLELVPDGPALVARQRRVAQVLTGGPELPAALARQPLTVERRPLASGGRRLAVGLVSVAVAAALASATLFVVRDRPTIPPPTVAAAAQPGFGTPLERAPRSRPGHPALVSASFEGIDFPNWSRRFGWHTTGARSDRIGGRETTTVFYGHMGHRIGYTVVSGSPLETPPGRHVTRNGVAITLVGDHMHALAVFVRNGRTCILSAHVAHEATLVKLASWKGEGGVRF